MTPRDQTGIGVGGDLVIASEAKQPRALNLDAGALAQSLPVASKSLPITSAKQSEANRSVGGIRKFSSIPVRLQNGLRCICSLRLS